MNLSIIYIYFNTPKEIVNSINSIKDGTKIKSYEIIIVDNASVKKLPKKLLSNKKIIYKRNGENIGFGRACNLGASLAKGDALLFINTDTVFKKGSIDKLLSKLKHNNKIGVISPKMTDSRGRLLRTVNTFIKLPQALVIYSFLNKLLKNNPVSRKFWQNDLDRTKAQEVDVVGGACMMIPAKVFKKVKGFDPRFFMYFEEQDLCLRIKNAGYRIIFYPDSEITHLVGRSLSDKSKIKNYFERSRYLYFQKYYGTFLALFSELFLRFFTVTHLFASAIFFISLFINTYRQNSLMLLIGDAGRDFIAARDMILTHQIPLVGIPSSVVWLHQGPISVYGIGLAFLITNFNPIAPAIFYGVIGAITTYLVFLLGKSYFNERAGLLAGFLYATAPIVVVNARMPYHTSLIPFFACLFFLIFYKALKNWKLIPLVFLFWGLLLQVELSNIVVLLVVAIAFFIYKVRIKKNLVIISVGTFILGLLPFILYDLSNGPTYIKYPLWIINRLRLFAIGKVPTVSVKNPFLYVITTIYQQISGAISPDIAIVGFAIFLVSVGLLLHRLKEKDLTLGEVIVLLWILIPLVAYFLHSTPGTAYFALLYPAIILVVALFFDKLIKVNKLSIVLPLMLVVANVFVIFTNNFYVTTGQKLKTMPPTGYFFGTSWTLSNDTARAIVRDARGERFQLIPAGALRVYQTSIDPYKFLIWKNGGKIVDKAKLRYVIYLKQESKPGQNYFYSNFQDSVVKITTSK